MNKRQADLNAFDQSESDFVIGNLEHTGIQIEELTEINESNDLVCQVIESGLTGVIYQINNIDVQLSFLNELICRNKIMKSSDAFESLKNGHYIG